MVDKLNRDWKWRTGMSFVVALSAVATWSAMAYIAVFGVWAACGGEDEPTTRMCESDAAIVGGEIVLGLSALAIAATGIAWVTRGRGGGLFAWSIAGGLATAVALPFFFAA
jgi:hypothetical protein